MSPGLGGTPRVCQHWDVPHCRLPAGWGPCSPLCFPLSAFPRELDEEITADLADEVGAATLDWLVLRLQHLGEGAIGRGWLSESRMSLWLERG